MKDIIIDKFTDSILYFINHFTNIFINNSVNLTANYLEHIKQLSKFFLQIKNNNQ